MAASIPPLPPLNTPQPGNAASPTAQQVWEDFCEARKNEAYEAINANQAEYDKQLLTLSAGFLALTLAFLKDIVPLTVAIHRGWLYLSWGLLAACILCVLMSYQASINVLFVVIECWKQRGSSNPRAPYPDTGAARIRWINRLSGVLFVAGVGLTIAFAIVNLHNQAVKQEEKSMPNHSSIAPSTPSYKNPNPPQTDGAHINPDTSREPPPPPPPPPSGPAGDTPTAGQQKNRPTFD